MADRSVDHLLIGGGIAAASCAAALRSGGGAGSIVLVGREPEPPYHRPPCSKGYLQGREEIAHVELPDDVEVLTRVSVMGLDPVAREATLSTKETVAYGSALVATGAMVRRLAVEGAQLEGIHYLRAPGNADAIRRDAAEHGGPAVLIGGSFIGCEVAASLTRMGVQCTVVMQEAEPMERAFGAVAGRFVRGLLESHGVTVLGSCAVAGLRAADGDGERVGAVELEDGRSLPARFVVCGTGANPDVMLARKAGLPIGDRGGVACDSALRVAGFDGLWAAGDMCEFDSALHGGPVRIEHEEVAAGQGRTAARGMLGAPEPFTDVPYFWSDLADWVTLEHVGAAQGWDEEVVEGDPASGAFTVLHVHDGTIRGVTRCGNHGDLDAARARIGSRR